MEEFCVKINMANVKFLVDTFFIVNLLFLHFRDVSISNQCTPQ